MYNCLIINWWSTHHSILICLQSRKRLQISISAILLFSLVKRTVLSVNIGVHFVHVKTCHVHYQTVSTCTYSYKLSMDSCFSTTMLCWYKFFHIWNNMPPLIRIIGNVYVNKTDTMVCWTLLPEHKIDCFSFLVPGLDIHLHVK